MGTQSPPVPVQPMRVQALDNLKVVLISAIIAIHGVLGYAGYDEWWSYADVQETVLRPETEIILMVLVGPFALFMIALLFLMAGLLAAPSLQRNGIPGFVRARLLRLGLPFLVFTLFLWPALMYALYHPLGMAPGSYWEECLSEEGYIDAGPLWFVGVLLIFSLAYAGVEALMRLLPLGTARRLRKHRSRGPGFGWLLLITAVAAAASFVVRLAYPFGTETVTDLNPWEWPVCLALFVLGIVASGRGWMTEVPRSLYRRCRIVTLIAVTATAGLVFLAYQLGTLQHLLGGWNPLALAFAVIESTLSVFGSIWILGAAQQHVWSFRRWGPALRRSSYAAFLVQGPILIGIAVALRPLEVVAEVKAAIVATGGVAGSFALAWLLIRSVPPLARVL